MKPYCVPREAFVPTLTLLLPSEGESSRSWSWINWPRFLMMNSVAFSFMPNPFSSCCLVSISTPAPSLGGIPLRWSGSWPPLRFLLGSPPPLRFFVLLPKQANRDAAFPISCWRLCALCDSSSLARSLRCCGETSLVSIYRGTELLQSDTMRQEDGDRMVGTVIYYYTGRSNHLGDAMTYSGLENWRKGRCPAKIIYAVTLLQHHKIFVFVYNEESRDWSLWWMMGRRKPGWLGIWKISMKGVRGRWCSSSWGLALTADPTWSALTFSVDCGSTLQHCVWSSSLCTL